MNWKKQIDDIKMLDETELVKLKKETPKFSPEYSKWFEGVVGKGFNFTRKEIEDMKYSLRFSIQRWRIKGLIGKNELPDTGCNLVWSWKMTFDKEQTIKMVKSLSKRINNYKRKMFGLKDGNTNEPYIAHMIDVMMREGFPITYPNQEMISRFFDGGNLDGIE